MTLDIKLSKKRYWDVAQVTDMIDLYPGKERMIQAIKDLGPIIDAAGDPVVNDTITLVSNFGQFFRNFLRLFKSLQTPIRGFDIKYGLDKNGVNHYHIVINCFYAYDSQTLYAMPLSFLPGLAKKNKKLHDMMVDCITLLKWKGVPVIDHPMFDEDDMLLENMGEYISSGESSCCTGVAENQNEDKDLAAREFNLYTKYHKKYTEKVFSKFVPAEKIQKKIDTYKPQIKIERDILDWCLKVLDAAKEPHDLESFNEYAKEVFCEVNDVSIEEIYDNGNPVEICQVMRFTWFGNQAYTNMETQDLGEWDGNFGSFEFSHEYECHSKEDIDAARQKFLKDWGMFPEKLTKVLETGYNLVDDIWKYIDNKLIVILDTDV